MSCNCIPSDNITRFQRIICCMSSSWHLMICFLTGEESKITRFMRGNSLSFGHVHPSQEEPRCCEFTIYPTICNVIWYNSTAFGTSILQFSEVLAGPPYDRAYMVLRNCDFGSCSRSLHNYGITIGFLHFETCLYIGTSNGVLIDQFMGA